MPQKQTDKQLIRAKTLDKKTVTINDNVERTDYVDECGKITFAADVGYATVVKTTTSNTKLEQYYDENGKAVMIYPGYSSLRREYDNKGYNYHTTYLGEDGIAIITSFGYSDKYQQFYDDGKIKKERYYDPFGKPVCTKAFGAGLINEYYDDGRTVKTTFISENEEPIMVEPGYAMVIRTIYTTEGTERGKVDSEFYYNEKGEPIALSLGQYGVHKEYDENGLESLLVYLNLEGNPIITNKGYTSVSKTYYNNNLVASERYYDINNQPFSLAEGQYGIKKENEKIIYLDQKGNDIFNLKRFLYNQTWVIIPCTLILIVLLALFQKWHVFYLAIYSLVIIYLTLLFRENREIPVRALLYSYRRFLYDAGVRIDIIRNIWLFIPFGAILFRICPNIKVVVVPLLLSTMIEGIQYFTDIGFCELDDVISNSIGGCIGFYAEKVFVNFLEHNKTCLHTKSK